MPYIRIGKGDFINGEIVSEKSMVALFNLIQEHHKSQVSQPSLKTFYDLGSGMGKPTIAGALKRVSRSSGFSLSISADIIKMR